MVLLVERASGAQVVVGLLKIAPGVWVRDPRTRRKPRSVLGSGDLIDRACGVAGFLSGATRGG
jgi:hypothetical protein